MLLAFKQNAFCRPDALEHSIDVISEAGFKGIGLVFDKPWLWLPDATAQRMNVIQKTLTSAGLAVASVSSCTASGYDRADDDFTPPGQRFGPSFTSRDPTERQLRIGHTKTVIDFAIELGCTNVDTSTGYWPKDMRFAEAWQNTRDCLADLAEYAEKRDISLNIEYEPGEFGPGGLFVGDAHTFLAMAADVGSPVLRATWDAIHSWVGEENLPGTVQLLLDAGRLGVVEFDDGGYDWEPKTGLWRRRHFHLVPGDGMIAPEYEAVLQTLVKGGFEGPVIVELYSQWDKDPQEACRQTYRYLTDNFRKFFR